MCHLNPHIILHIGNGYNIKTSEEKESVMFLTKILK